MEIRRNKTIDVTTVFLSCCLCVAPLLQAVDTAATSGSAVANSLLLPTGTACKTIGTLQQPPVQASTPPQLVYLVPSQPAPQPVQPTVQSDRGFFAELFLRHPIVCISAITATVGTGAYLIRSAINRRRRDDSINNQLTHHGQQLGTLVEGQRDQGRILTAVQRDLTQASTDIRGVNTSVTQVNGRVGAVQDEQTRQAAALAKQTTAIEELRRDVTAGFTSTNEQVSGLKQAFGTFTAEQHAAFEKREREEREAREKHNAHMEELFQEARQGNTEALKQLSEEMAVTAALANSRLEALEQGQATQREEFQADFSEIKDQLAGLRQDARQCTASINKALRRPNQVFILNHKQKSAHPRVKTDKSKTRRPRITWKSLNQID